MEPALISENKPAERTLGVLRRLVPLPLLRSIRSPYHFLLAFFAAFLYRFPSRYLTVIGVTGTKGKSTVVELTGAIFRKAGKRVATLSSLNFSIGEQQWPNTLKMTVPGRFKLQEFLRRAVDRGAKCLVLEMTSEAIVQHRHRFIKFAIAALVNVHPEHIESHGSFGAYRAAKGKLFKATKGVHVLNVDDPNFDFFNAFYAKKKIYYGLREKQIQSSPSAEYLIAEGVSSSEHGSEFHIGNKVFKTNLVGRFNISNALCAIAIAHALGIPWDTIQDAVSEFPAPAGRFEFVDEGQPFNVVVDFAHTPDSVEAVYKTLKEIFSRTRLICVLGSTGGGRDTWKRPVMGRIASRYCEEIILTNEDPYDENPHRILEDIKSGIPKDKVHAAKEILDRREAIEGAIASAKPGDTVVVTGKGGERWMVLARGKKIPWSDTNAAREILRESLR